MSGTGPVIYMVEHVFSMPEIEDAWNAWYADNIRKLLTVPGFRTAQRFKAIGPGEPHYMAMYTLDGGEVFESAAYRDIGGGGNASVRFRPGYKRWIRNLFDSGSAAPAVGERQRLLVVDAAEPAAAGADSGRAWLKAIGLHMTTAYRALTVVPAGAAEAESQGGRLYEPLTAQLASAAARSP